MSALPLAVRVAAGLAATAVERARRLPHDLIGLPVAAVSRAMQVSMRMQQQITELAIKGDNAIALLRTPSEEPPWAVFDEDDGLYRPPGDRTDSTAVAARDWQVAEDDAAAAGVDDITDTDHPTAETHHPAAETHRTIAEAQHLPTGTQQTPDEAHHTLSQTNHTTAEAHDTPAEPEAQYTPTEPETNHTPTEPEAHHTSTEPEAHHTSAEPEANHTPEDLGE